MSSKSSPSTTNDFYFACRNGLIDQVRQQLSNLNLDQIDQIQGNGSTALHAACYYNHTEIVKLLLDHGASRSIENLHKCLPYDEAGKEDIKILFLRKSTRRFCDNKSDYIDWIQYNADAASLANNFRFRQTGRPWINKSVVHLLTYIQNEIPDIEKNRINSFIVQAQNNLLYLLKAFTVESQFYISLNKDLSRVKLNQNPNIGIKYFVDCFYNCPTFENLSYSGKVYRGMWMTNDDSKQYCVGSRVINKIFLSTTKEQKLAEEFALKSFHSSGKQSDGVAKVFALCTYEIINKRTGLNIEHISEYRNEKEVLIGPHNTFLITTIRQISHNYVEFDLRECEKEFCQDDDFDDD